MNSEARTRLLDALNACRAIEGFLRDKSFEDYQADLLLRSGVERQFEIVGEALHQAELADPDARDVIPDLGLMVGMRNRIIHGYNVVDNKVVWDTSQNDLPGLAQQIEAALA